MYVCIDYVGDCVCLWVSGKVSCNKPSLETFISTWLYFSRKRLTTFHWHAMKVSGIEEVKIRKYISVSACQNWECIDQPMKGMAGELSWNVQQNNWRYVRYKMIVLTPNLGKLVNKTHLSTSSSKAARLKTKRATKLTRSMHIFRLVYESHSLLTYYAMGLTFHWVFLLWKALKTWCFIYT